MKKSNLSVVGTELAKTVGGFMVGRYAVVMGKKALKINEEVDPKKKKLKEVGLGLGVTALGVVGSLKAPDQYKSICAGLAASGAISAMTPFAKEDAGFIPALHGSMGAAELEEHMEDSEAVYELNAVEDYNELLDNEDQDEINALESVVEDAEEAQVIDEVN